MILCAVALIAPCARPGAIGLLVWVCVQTGTSGICEAVPICSCTPRGRRRQCGDRPCCANAIRRRRPCRQSIQPRLRPYSSIHSLDSSPSMDEMVRSVEMGTDCWESRESGAWRGRLGSMSGVRRVNVLSARRLIATGGGSRIQPPLSGNPSQTRRL